MFWSRPPWDRHGSSIVGELYDGALMSFGTQVQVWNPSKPSASSSAPVSRGSEPGHQVASVGPDGADNRADRRHVVVVTEERRAHPAAHLPVRVRARGAHQRLAPGSSRPSVERATKAWTTLPELAPAACHPAEGRASRRRVARANPGRPRTALRRPSRCRGRTGGRSGPSRAEPRARTSVSPFAELRAKTLD